MTIERLAIRSERKTSRRGAVWLIAPSVIIAILLAELLCRLFFPSMANNQSVYKWDQRIIFFDGPETVFQNHGDIFTYVPHKEIRNVTAYFFEHDFTIEFDYRFRTNNVGLVQDADVGPEQDSLLLLGDSFTEGHGAEPWFRQVSPEIAKLGYQPVNGGLLGTGFEQWLKLDRYLIEKSIRIGKLVVMFISDDYARPVWNFSPPAMQCLSDLARCQIDASIFYRLPSAQELSPWIAKVRAARTPMMKMKEQPWLAARVQTLLPASYHIYKYFKERGQQPDPGVRRAERQSDAAIAELIGRYGSANVAFIHLPQKDEVDGPGDLGLRARRSIKEAGGRLYDGLKLCRLTAADYYRNDGHPNRHGYAKIAACTTEVIKLLAAGG